MEIFIDVVSVYLLIGLVWSAFAMYRVGDIREGEGLAYLVTDIIFFFMAVGIWPVQFAELIYAIFMADVGDVER